MRIRDHRNTRHTVTWRPSIESLDVDHERSLLEHRLTVVTKALRRVEFQRRVMVPLCVIGLGVLISFITGMTQANAKTTGQYMAAGFFIVLLMLLSLLVVFGSARAARRLWGHFSRDCGAAGLCAACGYGIEQAPVDDEDGCRICPECGGAWRAEA